MIQWEQFTWDLWWALTSIWKQLTTQRILTDYTFSIYLNHFFFLCCFRPFQIDSTRANGVRGFCKIESLWTLNIYFVDSSRLCQHFSFLFFFSSFLATNMKCIWIVCVCNYNMYVLRKRLWLWLYIGNLLFCHLFNLTQQSARKEIIHIRVFSIHSYIYSSLWFGTIHIRCDSNVYICILLI